LYPLRTKELASPYPFTQSQLYKSRQPTIFMIDNGYILWLWQGWWPHEDGIGGGSGSSGNDSDGSGSSSPSIDNRSGENRWQAERRAAMETAVSYWQTKMKGQGGGEHPKKNGHSHTKTTSTSTKLKRQPSSASSSSTCSITSSSSSISDDGLDEVDQDIIDGTRATCDIHGYIVWAGLEPIQFKSMFPDWEDRDDIAEINIQVSD
jgi:supervillin